MKKSLFLVLVLLGALLAGCAAQETFETVSDEAVVPAAAQQELSVTLPDEALVGAISSEGHTLYLCDGYELYVQNYPNRDAEFAIRQISGYDADALTLLETQEGAAERFDFVWTCMEESGAKIGRAAVLDDGTNCYVLSAMADADMAGELQKGWNQIFQSLSLSGG